MMHGDVVKWGVLGYGKLRWIVVWCDGKEGSESGNRLWIELGSSAGL